MSTAAAPTPASPAERALAYIVAWQEEHEITGREMARMLGMREQEWSRIKRGHRAFGPLQRERACQVFPALREILFGVAS